MSKREPRRVRRNLASQQEHQHDSDARKALQRTLEELQPWRRAVNPLGRSLWEEEHRLQRHLTEIEVLRPSLADELLEEFEGRDQLQRKLHEAALENMREDYEESKNPLHAWAAYEFARKFDLEIPEWVLGYLDGAAKGLMQMPQALKEVKRKGKENRTKLAAAEALGFTIYDACGKYERAARDWELYFRIEDEIEASGPPRRVGAAIVTVASQNKPAMDVGTLSNIYLRLRKRFRRLLKD